MNDLKYDVAALDAELKSKPVIVYSAMRTPDGTLLRSRHRHDFVSHTDENGKRYFLDGGMAYIRSSAHGDERFATYYQNDPHDVLREYVDWGSYGKNGDEPLRYIKVKDMETGHLEAVIDMLVDGEPLKPIFENELEYRKK
jgi:hypothetical protein